ncbi:MAG: hypothetical protein EXR99_15105 [Gemmataceae bacterium]|nr:hypothetical protein [Gemmataceae bacterium]
MLPYDSHCSSFGLFANFNTKLPLPTQRETVLNYFEAMRRTFPQLTDFDCRDNGEFSLEEDRETDSRRWITLESKRVCAGFLNPPSLETADAFHMQVLQMTPYHLDFNPLDCEALDVVFAFDYLYAGNHDEVVAETLGAGPPLEGFLQIPGSKVLNYEPSIMLALDDSCGLQCRLQIETRTNPLQVKTGQFAEANISVLFTIRQYWNRKGDFPFSEAYLSQRETCSRLVDQHIAPNILKPLAQAIATRQ